MERVWRWCGHCCHADRQCLCPPPPGCSSMRLHASVATWGAEGHFPPYKLLVLRPLQPLMIPLARHIVHTTPTNQPGRCFAPRPSKAL